jgi:hypothetical protein
MLPIVKGMQMRASKFGVCLFLFNVVLVAQSDRGTITGAVSDPADAAVANAVIQLKNSETGVLYQAATTATGNYTVAQLPVGTYDYRKLHSGAAPRGDIRNVGGGPRL